MSYSDFFCNKYKNFGFQFSFISNSFTLLKTPLLKRTFGRLSAHFFTIRFVIFHRLCLESQANFGRTA